MEIARRVGPALASLLIAVVLWLVVHNLDRSPARFVVPITYEGDDDVVVLDDRISEVEVQVRATKPTLRSLQATAFVVKVRHPPGRLGREFVVLDASDVEAPFGVVVERVTPSQFAVTYDRRERRELAVRATVDGRPAEGHEVVASGVATRPPTLLLSGPASLFGDRTTLGTERVDVSGRAATLVAPHVSVLTPGASFTLVGPSTVEVTVPIRPVRLRRTFEDVEVEVIAGPSRASRPNPRSIKVTVEGDEAELASLPASAVKAHVDASALEPREEDYRLEPTVTVSAERCPSCKVVARSQSRVDLTVKPSSRRARSGSAGRRSSAAGIADSDGLARRESGA